MGGMLAHNVFTVGCPSIYEETVTAPGELVALAGAFYLPSLIRFSDWVCTPPRIPSSTALERQQASSGIELVGKQKDRRHLTAGQLRPSSQAQEQPNLITQKKSPRAEPHEGKRKEIKTPTSVWSLERESATPGRNPWHTRIFACEHSTAAGLYGALPPPYPRG